KVWGNKAAIRNALGWPIRPEIGFSTYLTAYTLPTETGQALNVGQIDGQTMYILPRNGSYGWENSLLPFIGTYENVQIAFQTFDTGYMLWRADNESVVIFEGTNSGNAGQPDVLSYAQLPDATGTPPPGHFKPINAFGKVWGVVGKTIGWPTAPE